MASCGNEFTFTWRVENFSCLPHQPGERLISAVFIVEAVMKSKWCLWFYPKGYSTHENKGKDHISIFLCNLEPIPLTVSYELLIETTSHPFQLQSKSSSTITSKGMGIFDAIPLSNFFGMKDSLLFQDVLTIKCRIWPKDKNNTSLKTTELNIAADKFGIQSFSTTRIKVDRRSLNWSIRKISKHIQNHRKTSISFNSALNNSPSLNLSFSLSEDSNEEYARIEILPTRSPYEGKRLFVKGKMTILTADKLYQHSIENSHLFTLQLDDIWRLPPFIEKKNLRDGKYIYIDDTLLIQCHFAFSCLGTEYDVEAPQYAPWTFEVKKPTKGTQLCGSIHPLYTSGDFCDVTVHAAGETFPAHKLVLCARSSVFCAMFQTDMKENATNAVVIDDVDAATMNKFFVFLYSDTVDEGLTSEEAINLYKVADKYKVDLLKQQCSILLLSTLSVSSVPDVLALADARQDHFLMTAAVYNFLHCHFSETFNSLEWQKFMVRYPRLSESIMLKAWKSKPFP